MEFFLGIKIKVQFRHRFLRNHGQDFTVRFQRQYQRHQTFGMMCVQNPIRNRAADVICMVLSRASASQTFIEKVLYFREKIKML